MAFSLKVDKVRVLLIEQFDRVSVGATMGWLEGAQLSNTTLTVDPATKHAILQESQRLEALSKPEIDQEYNELVQRQREAEIAGHWYNQTGLKANYQLWLRMPYWSLEEGLVLLSRRDPNSVSLAALEKEHKYVPFAVWLRDSLEMAKRSANVGLLKPNNAPSVFVSWAKDNKFEIAPELEEKMAEFGLSVL